MYKQILSFFLKLYKYLCNKNKGKYKNVYNI